ncbi:MAG TPA: type II secretion system F family protein [Mycobacteriales bacterium]|nr:type II secretion system F family protein [Mycobacteriales bacterium]
MIGTALLALAVALVRPPSPATARLRGLRGRIGLPRPSLPTARVGVVLPAVCGAAALGCWSRFGFGSAVPVLPAAAGAVTAGTAAVVLSRAAAERGRRRSAARLVESVGTLAADLRAGQQPAEALAALDGDAVTRHHAVRAVWAVSERSGAPAAAVLDRVEQDLQAREEQHREIAAQLAGARSTAGMLAILPVLGIGLGAAMGARPLAVLLGEVRGQLALVVGVVLEALGVLWTARIVTGAQGPR